MLSQTIASSQATTSHLLAHKHAQAVNYFQGATQTFLLPPRRAARRWHRLYREVRMVALALKSPRHPVLAHIVPIRRCNLSCTYCNKFDAFSKPVPTAEMLHRTDSLAALGTTVITLSGGGPLIHSEAEELEQLFPAQDEDSHQRRLPTPVRILSALFLPAHTERSGRFFRGAASRILGIN